MPMQVTSTGATGPACKADLDFDADAWLDREVAKQEAAEAEAERLRDLWEPDPEPPWLDYESAGFFFVNDGPAWLRNSSSPSRPRQ